MLAGSHQERQKAAPDRPGPCGVLCSAGLDSAVLVAMIARSTPVVPFYVSVGLAWETAERRALARLLAAPPFERVAPPVVLSLDMRDVYPESHWAIRGTPPAYDTPDEDVYIIGRNVVLLTKAGVACAHRAIERLAIGPLAGNPFPDATPEFFDAMSRALTLGLGRGVAVEAPLASMSKAQVVRLGHEMGVPFELTLSCMNPQGDRHCGRCSKCRERRDAFAEAGLEDAASYATPSPR